MSKGYVPRILLCGDLNSFRAAANMEVEIVGQISFFGSPECNEHHTFSNSKDLMAYVSKVLKIFLNGEEISGDELRKILDGAADYIVFDSSGEYVERYNDLSSLKISYRFIPRETLFRQARHNFYVPENPSILIRILSDNKISRVLDVDGFLYETDLFMFETLFPCVDGVIKNPAPIIENFYCKIYSSLDDCRFRIYDAVLLCERSLEKFIDAVIETDALSEKILTFARKNSSLEKFLTANKNVFEKILNFPAVNGSWYLIKKFVRADFKIYVVTHKDVKLDALPEGYEIIHAGHAIAKEEFGYLADDTGENISRLNLWLNEVTALYWMWKHTSHAIIGLNHYRRFFTESEDKKFAVEKILSREAAEKILRDHDIIVAENKLMCSTISSWQQNLSGVELEQFVSDIFKKHIVLKQPDYLGEYENVAAAYTAFQYEIFITRRNIFEAYCEWLFSFLIDAMEDVLKRTNIREVTNPRKYRITSFITERLMTVWLRRNRLRIKKLPVLFREGI